MKQRISFQADLSGNKEIVKAIIVAAGEGKRFGAGRPKQFLRIGDRTVLEHAILPFQKMDEIHEIIIVLPARYVGRYSTALKRKFSKVGQVVPGGAVRSASVRRGLLAAGTAALFLIHDGARPCVSRELIRRVLAEAGKHGAALAAVRARDTVKDVDRGGFIAKTLDREKIFLAQTPQGFRADVLGAMLKKMARGKCRVTDEAALAERAGIKVKIVEGEETNWKITTLRDLQIARGWMRRR